ncbi:MAG: hypothetical protein GY916_14230, partial [Gammaproteobacteria bacterium]|nr:hypothetical protein [Gammaproteobacteria bacterium]
MDRSIPPAPSLGFILVSLPDAGGVVTITGQDGSVEAFSEAVIVNTRTGEISIVNADANGAFSADVNGLQGDSYAILSEDAAGNQSESVEVNDGSLPDDPAEVAPALNPTQTTSIFDATAFLYSGADPIQTGVAPGTIDPARAAVIRGRILDRNDNPIPGVTITIKEHPEFGQTLSRSDGQFDMVVNGGGQFILNYRKESYLPAQRNIKTVPQDYFWLDDVVMIQLDPQVTAINLLSTAPIQVAQGSVETDADGSRQATLMFTQGTSALMTLSDGTTQPLTSMSVRATEYTVGENGPDTMPAPLPPMSGYTYAVELSVDEAIAANATSVTFNQPVKIYLENFAGFNVGVRIPVGYYDFDKAAWLGSQDGRIIQVTAINNGIAELDIDGDGVADDAAALADLNIDQAELEQVALQYSAGQSLWRVQVSHFSPWDFNWPYGPLQVADYFKGLIKKQTDKETPNNPADCGCIIGATKQTLGEFEPIAGTDLDLFYQSYYSKGYIGNQSLNIPVTSANPPSGLAGVRIDIDIAGARTTVEFDSSPNQEYTFVWDGLDGYGREVRGNAAANVYVRYQYPVIRYESKAEFQQSWGNAGNDIQIGGSRAEGRYTLGNRYSYNLGQAGVPSAGLGGWALSNHHAYDAYEQSLYMGTGEEIRADRISDTLQLIAGGGNDNVADNVPATDASFFGLSTLVPTADGGYITGSLNRIHKVGPDDIIHLLAGNGSLDYTGDGGPAVNAGINLTNGSGIVVDRQGNIFFADTFNNAIRRIDTNGIITTVAGGDPALVNEGDGGLAIDAKLRRPVEMAINSEGTLFVVVDEAKTGSNLVRMIRPDGTIDRFAGTGYAGYGGDGGQALDATISRVTDMITDSQDNIYITSWVRVRKISPDGIIERVTGGGTLAPASGVLATDVLFDYSHCSLSLAVDRNDRLYVGCSRKPSQIFLIENDYLALVAGVDDVDTSSGSPDGGLAQAVHIGHPLNIAILNDQSLIYTANSPNRVYRIKPAFPVGFQDASFNIASTDAQSIYQFDAGGKHLRTLNAITGSVIDEFSYTAEGLLDKVTDAFGSEITIQRDAIGNPLSVTSAYGQVTSFGLDANGYLASIVNPLGDSIAMVYGANGLMTDYSDKNNNPSVFTYGPTGRLLTDVNAIGGGWTLDRNDIDDTSYSVSMTTGEGRTKQYTLGDPTSELNTFSVTNIDGSTYTNERYLDGRLVEFYADGTQAESQKAPDPRFGMQAQFAGTTSTVTPAGLSLNNTFDRDVVLADPDNPLSLASITETETRNGRT